MIDMGILFAACLPRFNAGYVCLQVHESVGLSSTLLAVLYAPIPDANLTTSNVQLENMEFSSDIIKQHGHIAVGSGIGTIMGHK